MMAMVMMVVVMVLLSVAVIEWHKLYRLFAPVVHTTVHDHGHNSSQWLLGWFWFSWWGSNSQDLAINYFFK